MPVRAARQPGLDPRRLVGGIIVHDDMHILAFGHLPVDLLEEVEELRRTVVLVALSDHCTGGDVEGGEQRSGAVSGELLNLNERDSEQRATIRKNSWSRSDKNPVKKGGQPNHSCKHRGHNYRQRT